MVVVTKLKISTLFSPLHIRPFSFQVQFNYTRFCLSFEVPRLVTGIHLNCPASGAERLLS